MGRANYYQEFGKKHRRPGFFTNVLSWFILVLPKVGPLRSLKIKAPGPVAEKLFIQSFDTTLLRCSAATKILGSENIYFTNIDFDTGNNTEAGEYKLADVTYGKLILKLNKEEFNYTNTELKQNIIEFYNQVKPTDGNKKERKEWKKITHALERLTVYKPI